MKQKGFAPIIILILLVLVAGVYYLLFIRNQPSLVHDTDWWKNSSPFPLASTEPTSGTTANWRTYTFIDWGVSIKAPFDPSQNKTFYVGSKKNFDVSKIPPCPTGSAKTLCLTKPVETIVLDGKQAILFYVDDPTNNDLLTEVIQTTEKPYGEISSSDSSMGAYIIFDQILSTFQFTK